MNDADRIGIAGDWHGHAQWAVIAIHAMAALLGEHPLILQLGDLGVYPDDGRREWMGRTWTEQTFLEAVSEALEACDGELVFIEGNHEDHELLKGREAAWRDACDAFMDCPCGSGDYDSCQDCTAVYCTRHGDGQLPRPVIIAPRITWLPRGYRWQWHDRTWLACGGAVSVDKLLRTEGTDWFAGEEITDEEEAMIIAGGHADVVVSHDAPRCVGLQLMSPPPRMWEAMIPAAEAHRERMQRIGEGVTPSWWFHGHYHQTHCTGVRIGERGGWCEVRGLHMNGCDGNWGILDLSSMTWLEPGEPA
jgi:hypothetical protein